MRLSGAALLLLLGSFHGFAAPAVYRVSYSGGTSIQVEAHLPPGDGRLLVRQGGGIDHLPAQWATFVRDLRVTNAGGAAVPVTPLGKEGWSAASTEALDLSYRVELTYASEAWPAGNEQSGKLFPAALYTVTKPLFVHTSGVTDASVELVVPAGWRIVAPWPSTGSGRFHAPTLESLIDNTIVVGRFSSADLTVDAFDVTVATPDEAKAPARLVSALQRMGNEAAAMFPGTPEGRYLMTFFRAEAEDGESYESSAALTSPYVFDDASMVVTGNTVVHELLHHWIGGMLAPVEHDSLAWFTEGFTEYYANLMLARSGAVSPPLMRAKLANIAGGYSYFMESPLFRGVTVADAGQKKGAHRFGVYNGGWAIALSLDVMLRSESKGTRSLATVMSILFERYGKPRKPITENDIRAAVNEVAGRDLSAFFEQYLHARNELPLAETFAKLGLELRGQPYAADMYVVEMPAPSAAQKELRAQMFGKAKSR
jgi:predicted metalloprotease with PDZ domain